MSSSMGSARTRKNDPLAKRTPSNPKYKDIQAVVDTGSSMSKYLKKIEEIKTNYRYKPNELFKRMKLTTFVQLVIQVSSVDGDFLFDDVSQAGDTTRPSTVSSELQDLENIDSARVPAISAENGENSNITPGLESSRSTLQGLVTGVGEFNVNHPDNEECIPATPKPDPNLVDRPFLLLDCRDKDEFEQCHIITAENFPIAVLSRSCNYESKSMLAFKNQPGKIIMIYDEDERIAPKAATTLVERGYDNLYLLSGGLKVAVKLYSHGLLTGTPPSSIALTKPVTVEKATRDNFTREDVFALLDQTESAVDKMPGSRMSTQASRQSSKPPGTATSAMSSVSTGTVIHRKPFR